VDYKVIVLAIEEEHVNKRLQELLADPNNQLKVDDASKIVGCWKALAKQGLREYGNYTGPMRRAVAFCQVIAHHRSEEAQGELDEHRGDVPVRGRGLPGVRTAGGEGRGPALRGPSTSTAG
jgi:hypothetical protein